MSDSNPHFTSEQLSAYILGASSKPEAERISAHVGDCPSCLEALDHLSQHSDPFLDKLRKIADSLDPAPGPHAPGPNANPVVPGYDVLGVLGRGGMGVVYRARQVGLNRLVALKMISAGAHASPEQQVRFRKEAAAVAQLQHPGIVQIFDVGGVDGLPYFAMELVEGANLKDVIAGSPQNPRNSARLTRSLALAIQAAHDKGIIHRDLKPANILLKAEAEPGAEVTTTVSAGLPAAGYLAKITDFGLARLLDEDGSLTRSGALAGTPGFMAPEQTSAAAKVDVRADVYALGATLYNLITGRPPFHADTPIETLKQVQQQEPIAPRSLNPTVDRDLDTICLKCLEKDPARRYPTARALADDLERYEAGEPIRARKIGPVGKVWRWAKRNGRLATVSAVLLFLLLGAAIAGPIVALSFNALASSEQKAAQDARLALQKAEKAEAEARAAAEKAEDLRHRAETEAAVSKEVSRFLLGLFDDADPIAWSGRAFGVTSKTNPTAEEIVERGARQLAANEELKAKPLVRAALLDRVGAIYVGLGNTEKGRPFLNEALALRRKHLPPRHQDLVDSLASYANLHFAEGEFAKAESVMREALDMQIALVGPDNRSVADLRTQLGIGLLAQAKRREAASVLVEALEVYRAARRKAAPADAAASGAAASGRESPWVFVALGGLIYVYAGAEDAAGYLKAAPLIAELREVARKLPDEQTGRIVVHFVEAQYLHAAGMALQKVAPAAADKMFKSAEQEFLKALEPATKIGTGDHYLVVALQRDYGSFLMDRGRWDEAERIYVQVVAVFRRQFGDRAPAALSHALYNLARCVAYGRVKNAATAELRLTAQQEAEALSREAVKLDEENPKRSNSGYATHLLFHGVLLLANPSNHAEAEACLREAMRLRREEYPAGSMLNMHPFRSLLTMFVAQRRYPEAEALLRDEWKRSTKREWPERYGDILYQQAETCARDKANGLALALLDAAVEAGFRNGMALRDSPAFEPIRLTAEYQRLLKRLEATPKISWP
ncbi:MAG: serine/threonine-protein kinase [Gemmataceae bacterium]